MYFEELFVLQKSVMIKPFVDVQGGLKNLLESIKDKDADKVSVGLSSSLDIVAQLELLQVCMSF